MKTKKQTIEENPDFKALINAVISRIGKESIKDVNNHGIDGGFSGFIYYSDTHAFTIKYKKQILKLLERSANDGVGVGRRCRCGCRCMINEDIIKMVKGFGVFRNSPMDADDKKDLDCFLAGKNPEQGAITNVLAWFAAEEVCRLFDN